MNAPHFSSVKELFAGVAYLALQGDEETVVKSLITDSRRVIAGSAFFAIPGLRTNGDQYVEEAIARGAEVIVSTEVRRPMDHIVFIQVKDVRQALAQVAKRFYNAPDEQLSVIGITGTNGKSTVARMVQFLLQAHERKSGLIGTILYDLGDRTLPSFRTTPESVDNYAMFAQMVHNGCRYAVMEVSSHGIDQCRVDGVAFACVAFLNLTADHLDYHETMADYFETKARLFLDESMVSSAARVINRDDPYGESLSSRVAKVHPCLCFGVQDGCDLQAKDIVLDVDGARFVLSYEGKEYPVVSSLLGRYNVSNALAALSIGLSQGLPLLSQIKALAEFDGVPGRMEKVACDLPYTILVDYAHTPDALENALQMLKEITKGQLWVVFGCGGNRDRSKRPAMVQAVQRWCDGAWATADNPRDEALSQIFMDMKAGVQNEEAITFINDRKQAIRLAIEAAQPNDCVLIAGKGHETYQEIKGVAQPFDDRLVVQEILRTQAWKVD